MAREEGSATRTTYEAAFLQAGAPLLETYPLGEPEAIKRSVEAGLGIGIVSRFSVDNEVRAGRLKRLRISDVHLTRPLRLLYRSGRDLSHETSAFLAFLREAAGNPSSS